MILDWDLAILSGEEVIRLVRKPETSPAPTMPLILMRAQPQKGRVERGVGFGVNEVITKPFSPLDALVAARCGHQSAKAV